MKGVKRGVLYDAGGGVGNYGWFFGKEFEKVIVSDVSKLALSKIPEKEIVKINCSIIKNKLPDNSVDCVLLTDVFEHIDKQDLLEMMKDLRRILNPKGRIIIFTSHFGFGLGAITQRIFNPKKRLLGDEHKEGHVNRLEFKEFKKLFSKSGLTIKDFYFYSVIFQQITDGIKDNFARLASSFRNKKKNDLEFGRPGQSTKEELRGKENKLYLKLPLLFLSLVSYSDIVLFGKWFPGNSIFFSLEKAE